MNKKLITLAVTSALAASSAVNADSKNVDVYGKLYPQYQVVNVTDGSRAGVPVSSLTDDTGVLTDEQIRRITTGSNTAQSTTNRGPGNTTFIESNNSYIGFKGQEDLGGGLKGWFQVETNLGMDTGSGTWASRNSAVGLTGVFGNLFIGKWDTVYKQLGDPVSFLGLSSGNIVSTSEMLSNIGFGRSNRSRFHERSNNYIEYDSPSLGGVQIMAGYSPDETEYEGDGVPVSLNRTLVSAGVKFEMGPAYVALAREIHKDFFGLASNVDRNIQQNREQSSSEDTATRLSLMFSFGDTKIGFDIANLEYDESARPVAGDNANQPLALTYEKKTMSLVGLTKVGPVSLAAALVKANDGDCTRLGAVCTTTGLGAKQLSLGAKYDLSKRTGIYLLGVKIDNGDAANYNVSRIVGPGVDQTGLAAGIVHTF